MMLNLDFCQKIEYTAYIRRTKQKYTSAVQNGGEFSTKSTSSWHISVKFTHVLKTKHPLRLTKLNVQTQLAKPITSSICQINPVHGTLWHPIYWKTLNLVNVDYLFDWKYARNAIRVWYRITYALHNYARLDDGHSSRDANTTRYARVLVIGRVAFNRIIEFAWLANTVFPLETTRGRRKRRTSVRSGAKAYARQGWREVKGHW